MTLIFFRVKIVSEPASEQTAPCRGTRALVSLVKLELRMSEECVVIESSQRLSVRASVLYRRCYPSAEQTSGAHSKSLRHQILDTTEHRT